MKLFSLFTLFAASSAGMIEIWDENGMVAYVDESERGSAVFGVPDKGPRECAGKKIPMVKHGKFHCKPLPKNKPRGKKRSASSNATQDSESNGPRRVKNPRRPRMVKSSAKPEKDGSPSQNPSNVSKTKFPVINKFLINSIAKIKKEGSPSQNPSNVSKTKF